MKITRLALCCCLVFGLTLTSMSSFSYNLPSMGSPTNSVLTADKEEILGIKFMQAVNNSLPLLSDPFVTQYIKSMGHRLVTHSPRPSQPFYFFVVLDNSINAFAGPYGYVGINTGLILKANTESELASVMAHEIAHVVQRHIMRGFTERKWLTLSNLAAMLAGIAVSTQNPEAGAGIISSATAGGYQQTLNYTRRFEKEADNIGMQILANANYNPCSMPRFFGILAKEASLNGDNIPELLRSHPVTENRLADAENRCVQYPKHRYHTNELEFNLIKARLINDVSYQKTHTVRKFQKLLKSSHKNNLALRYGYALALIKAHQFTQAQQQIKRLIQAQPHQLLFHVAQAELLQGQHRKKQSINKLKKLYQENPGNYSLANIYAHTLMQAKQYNTARKVLEPYERTHSKDDAYLFLLSQAQGHSKHLAKAYMTRAKAFMLYGNKKEAIQQLQMALKFTKKNPWLKQRIKKRLEKYRNQTD